MAEWSGDEIELESDSSTKIDIVWQVMLRCDYADQRYKVQFGGTGPMPCLPRVGEYVKGDWLPDGKAAEVVQVTHHVPSVEPDALVVGMVVLIELSLLDID